MSVQWENDLVRNTKNGRILGNNLEKSVLVRDSSDGHLTSVVSGRSTCCSIKLMILIDSARFTNCREISTSVLESLPKFRISSFRMPCPRLAILMRFDKRDAHGTKLDPLCSVAMKRIITGRRLQNAPVDARRIVCQAQGLNEWESAQNVGWEKQLFHQTFLTIIPPKLWATNTRERCLTSELLLTARRRFNRSLAKFFTPD